MKLKREKAINDSLVNRYLKSVSIESEYESKLKQILEFQHLKTRNFNNELDLYIEFDIFPPFNQDREIYIISNQNNIPILHYIKYNIKRECNSVIGNKALDKSCLTTFEKDSFKLSTSIIDSLTQKLDFYEFWNLKERTYNENEMVIMDGFVWRIEGIKGSNFDLPNTQTQYENKISRHLPENYYSIKNIGEYIISLKEE